MRSLITPLVFLLSTAPALGQDSKPVEKPSGKPAGTAIAEAIVKLRGAKLLKRLTEPRHYKVSFRGRLQLLTLSGKEEGPLLKIRLKIKRFDRPQRIEFTYDIGSDGRPKGFEIVTTRRAGTDRERRRGVHVVISDGKAVGTEIGKGARGTPREVTWTDEHVGGVMLWLVVPSLFDQGLPRVLHPRIVQEERLRGADEAPVPFTRSEKPTKNAAGALVHTFRCKTKREDLTITVAADGAHKGRVLSFSPGRGMSFVYITPKQAAQLEKDAPLLKNEAQAISTLRSVKYAQSDHQRNKGSFGNLEDLEKQDKYFKAGLEKLQATYLVVLRLSPDKTKWMAVAAPADPGKTGKRYFVTNQDGKVYASEKQIELDDSCAIPPKLEALN